MFADGALSLHTRSLKYGKVSLTEWYIAPNIDYKPFYAQTVFVAAEDKFMSKSVNRLIRSLTT